MRSTSEPKQPVSLTVFFTRSKVPVDQVGVAIAITISFDPSVTLVPSNAVPTHSIGHNCRAYLNGTGVKIGPPHGQYKTINTAALPNDPILKDFYIRFRYRSKQGIEGEWSKFYQFKRFFIKGEHHASNVSE
jgi:hypothetical protein